MKHQKGISLIEIIGSTLICGIIIAIGLPNILSMQLKEQQVQSVNQLTGALHYARNTAIMRRSVVTLCPGNDECLATQHWQNNILTFIDHNQNAVLDQEDELLQRIKIPDRQTWQWSNFRQRTYLQFTAHGRTPALNGTLSLCSDNAISRQIVINLTGRVRTQTQQAPQACR